MQKSHRKRPRVLGILVLWAGVACAPPAMLGGAARNHPSALARTWVDSAKTLPSDTALWVLDPSGDDASRHVRRAVSNRADSTSPAPFQLTGGKHYGYWYFRGQLEDSSNRAICFTNRPGRSAPTCLPFELDSAQTLGAFRRRLVVHGYTGAHSSTDRVLLERLP